VGAPSHLVVSSKRVRFMWHARAGFDLAYLVRKHGAAYASTPSEENGIRTRRNGRRGTKRIHLSYSGSTVETEVKVEGENNVHVWLALAVSGAKQSELEYGNFGTQRLCRTEGGALAVRAAVAAVVAAAGEVRLVAPPS